jgi:FkbH-like protein
MSQISKSFWPFNTHSTTLELTKSFRAATLRLKSLSEQPNTALTLLSNFSTQYLSQSIVASLIEWNIYPDLYESSFDQWELELNNRESRTHTHRSDFIIIALSSGKLILDERASSDPKGFTKYLRELIEQRKANQRCEILLTLPESLHAGYDHTSFFSKFVNRLRDAFTSELADITHLVDINPLIMEFGFDKWEPGKYLTNGQFCCHPNCYPLFGSYIANNIRNLINRSTKLVISDLDNTLWDGVLGELGWKEVGLDRYSSGYSHLTLQRYLLDLKNMGVLLAIASKNDESAAREAFEKRPEMVLKWGDFVTKRINWHPKSQNIEEILTELNLSSAGVVFLDDSKFEREEVRNSLPGITVPELAEDSSRWCSFLSRSGLFTSAKVSAEDTMRQSFYESEQRRRDESSRYANYEDFLKGLNLQIQVLNIEDSNFDRVFDLIQKTNQFNLTTKRHSRSELQTLLAKKGALGFCYQLRDKFCDYGIIAVTLAERCRAGYELDTFLMSCRVVGRGVETFVFNHLVMRYLTNDELLMAEYIPTQKNGPIASLLQNLGFEPLTSTSRWQFKKGLHQLPRIEHITDISSDKR